LLIAADEDPTSESDEYPYASRPRIIDQFVWADLKSILDGYVDRFSKTRLIKEYLKENKYHLKVCNDPPQDLLNCCTCEKCSRTIAPLVLEGIDPNTCGFTVNRPTFELMMQSLEKKKFEGWTSGWWKQMQDLIPCEMETDRFGSKDFLVWLKSLNINKVRKDSKLLRDLFSLFPYPLAVLFEALYSSAYNHSFVRSVNTLLKSSVHALRRLIKAN